ncbi:MAG: class I SAM-dependent methyltransferase [Alphaproteobacteria bacterium]
MTESRTRQTFHDMIAPPTADEAARQEYTHSLRFHLLADLWPGTRKTWDEKYADQFRKDHGRDPIKRREVARIMQDDPYWQMGSSLRRINQEIMWDTYGEKIEKHLDDLIAKAKKYRDSNRKLGSLMLDPDLEIPRYHTAVDVHIQPGAYHTDLTDDDVFAGALYDDVIWMFFMHAGGGLNDSAGRSIIAWLKQQHPKFTPKRILDMGCTVGHSTLPYVDAYRGAEVHAIDVGAPVLRYAHARAEGLGKPVHYSQQNAEATNFPDGHFDLVVSHLMFHETSSKAMPAIFDEAHRLLAPGGIMVHQDIAPGSFIGDTVDQFSMDWSTHYNAEPFIAKLMDLDHGQIAVDAGFAQKQVKELDIDALREAHAHPAVGNLQHITYARK